MPNSQPLLLVSRPYPSITILTLNRPDKRNALNIALMEEFCRLFNETEQLSEQRVVIITGAGPVFSAGLDLHDAVDPNLVEPSAELLTKLFTTIYQSRLISIAAIQGAAIAGGAGITTACDLAVAVKEAYLSYPEVHRGLVAAQVSVLLRRLLPLRQVRELLLTGELIPAERAREIGLINQVVDAADLMPSALEMAEQVLKGAPKAIEETKRLLTDLELISLSDDLKIAMEAHRRARLSTEAQEGIKTFFNEFDKSEWEW